MTTDQFIPLSKSSLFIWLKTLSNQLSKGSLIIDINDENLPILHANPQFLNLTCYTQEQLIAQQISIFNGPRTDEEVTRQLHFHLKTAREKKLTILHYTKNGSAFWNCLTLHPIRNEENVIQYMLITCEDTTESELNKMIYKLEHEVYEAINNENQLSSILDLISEKVENYYIRDIYCTIHIFDEQFQVKSLGSNTLPPRVLHQLDFLSVSPNTQFNADAVYLKEFEKEKQVQPFSHAHLHAIKGSWTKPVLTSQNKIVGILTLLHTDQTDLKQTDLHYLKRLALLIQLAMKYAEQKIELSRLAFYDVETNLPNVQSFKQELSAWIHAKETGFVAIIHPTEFNKIIDLYGRNAGAELLRQIADRMHVHLPAGDELVSRFSNSLILGKKAEPGRFSAHLKHVEQLTQTPFVISGKENYITLKIGYTIFDETMTVEQCIHQADIALSNARDYSGTAFLLYEENTTKQLSEEMAILNQLAYALQHGEFDVYLQPKINFTTLEVEGFEALSRWNSSKLGFISPEKYIPIAEQSGKIKDIDLLNFKKVLQWLQNRIDEGKKILPVALNISPDHFYDPRFIENIAHTFAQFHVPPHYIKLEVTESIELVDFTRAKHILEQLKALGIESSIDDFGVGFSSLSYLPKLPFSEIKIDRSFINSMKEPGMYAIVQTIIQLAKNIQMRPVAEGIETVEQLTMLQKLGCPAGQGYYFYKPMPLEEAAKLLN